jgi:hypothetical protein
LVALVHYERVGHLLQPGAYVEVTCVDHLRRPHVFAHRLEVYQTPGRLEIKDGGYDAPSAPNTPSQARPHYTLEVHDSHHGHKADEVELL